MLVYSTSSLVRCITHMAQEAEVSQLINLYRSVIELYTEIFSVACAQKPRVTELQVRMNCNGCVQRIKKTMHGIDGVRDIYVDFAQQKLTVVGTADPERIVKAIKKARKKATICYHSESNESTGTEQPPPPVAEPAAGSSNPPSNQPPNETTPPEPPKDAPPETTNTAPDALNPSPDAKDSTPEEPKDVEEIHMVHHYPNNYFHREDWDQNYTNDHEIRNEEAVLRIGHNYRSSTYASEYRYLQSASQDIPYGHVGDLEDGYYRNSRGADGNQITVMFSDENPNACTIV
ncbi:heavy metal-associated isoprenylated plant protein 5 [Canna indica]|uniref:Heavy metal-associated isoprenylated plant protein 5 n=1 Tax=Canna indica TaxID=4628 RepID=A0AAQ3L7H5_9LILI|nr:heavy metal-associated isoprenylated plant protein 5 [Canna indica]